MPCILKAPIGWGDSTRRQRIRWCFSASGFVWIARAIPRAPSTNPVVAEALGDTHRSYLNKIYPRVIFKKKLEWEAGNSGLSEGLTKFLATLKEQKADIKRQRAERGMDAKFSTLPNKPMPNSSGSVQC